MKIAILGASGSLGQRIAAEAQRRGHEVTGISRNPPAQSDGMQVARADIRDSGSVEQAIRGHDAVVSAIGPDDGEGANIVVDAARSISAACMHTGVRRVVAVGGAGSLEVEPGLELMNTPGFPANWREIARAHHDALEIWRKVKEIDWTVVSPAAAVEPGERTGRFRVGHNELLVDGKGQSRISMEDFAISVIDEIEHGSHRHERITVAY